MSRRIGSCSRREFLVSAGVGVAALALVSGCGPSPAATPTATPMPEATAAPPSPEPTVVPGLTPTAISPSLDEKIGQMIMVGFRGLELWEGNPILEDLRERHIGGVVLFDYDVPTQTRLRNVCSPEQVTALCAALQTAAGGSLLIAVDQEGGHIARLKERYGFPATLSEQELGSADDLSATRKNAETIATTLKAAGFNLNLAPVVDLNLNPDNPIIGQLGRSFSADSAVVTRHAAEVIRVHHENGVLTTLKHFPGHGSSKEDSHLGFVDVTDSWQEIELQPYKDLIAAGLVDAVMTAHIFNAHLDPELPATLSRPIINGLLREQLGFDGVVISDDMQMGAIRDRYGFEAAIQHAIEAGVDILAIANNSIFDPTVAAQAITVIKGLLRDKVITPERIDQSYARIARLKARL
jgi:beta-N-acetylhexosaminidase